MADPQKPEETLGRYTLLRKLGQGGMGEVHLAEDPTLRRQVALKVLPYQLVQDGERRSRFLREARAAAALRHPNITTIYEIGDADGRDFLAFEYVDGKTLQEAIEGRRLSIGELIDLAAPLADAIAYAHQEGIVHRDIKPDNVMLTARGEPKLLDFGLAKVKSGESWASSQESVELTRSGALVGTPSAMSPEQVLGKPVDERSDIFSFGSLLYRMASGKSPFSGDNLMEVVNAVVNEDPAPLSELRSDLSPDFVAVVERALQKDPEKRYRSMGELAADLRHLDRKATSLVWTRKERRPKKRSSLTLGSVGALVLLVLVFVFDLGSVRSMLTARGSSAIRSIAVLPLENLSGDPSQEVLADGMTEALITELGRPGSSASSRAVPSCGTRRARWPFRTSPRSCGSTR